MKASDEGFAGVVLAGFGVDFFDEALSDGFLERDGVKAPAHRVAALGDVANEIVEDGLGAAMGGDDGECAAPLGEWLGDAIEHALVLVKGEFVEFDVAAFAGECVWIGGEAMNAAAVSELEDVGAEVARIADGHLVEAFGAHLEPVCPAGAVFEIKPGLGFVARGNPDVVAGIVSAGFFDGVVGVDEGSADLTGLLHDFERGSIVVPFALEREKEFFFGAFHDK